MKVIYLDPSALLQWLLGQSGAEHVRRTVDRTEAVLTSTLTLVEVERALLTRKRQRWRECR